jgi:predicted porin
VSYDFGVAKLALVQRRWVFRPDRMLNTLVAAQVPVGAGVVKLSWMRGDQKGVADGNDATLLAAGYVYSFSKRTAAYVHAARVKNQGNAVFAVLGGGAVSATPTAPNYFGGQSSTGFELGLRHDF